MASPTELDIFSRSLGGDRRARIELYKKFLRDSSRVCRLGANYEDLNDFLHDCFANLLRTGHSWDKEGSLSRWVETVAVWTALLHERQHDMNARGAKAEIRMCAEIEGDDATHGEVLSAYAPPVLGADDSPSARVFALLNETEKAVLQKRAMGNGTWNETAISAGKPLNTVGTIFARVAARISRLFGAPPPMDDDLVPVFARAAADPQKPEGRSISLQLDAVFYVLTPEMQKIGLTTSYDARMLVLWDTAVSATPPPEPLRRHLDQCHYCTDLLRALILMHQALLSAPGVEFHLCPGSFTLANAADLARDVFDQHLAHCTICRAERTQVLEGQAPSYAPHAAAGDAAPGAGKKIAYVSAALLVLGLGSFAGYRYYAAREADAAKVAAPAAAQHLTPTVSVDMRYRDLVQDVPMDDGRILASVLPTNRQSAKNVIDQFMMGDIGRALSLSSQVAAKGNDPGIQMLYAMCLYRSLLMTDGYREMLKSEAMPPREPFRCWIMFEFGLMVGEKGIMQREAEHLSSYPEYQDRVKKIMDRVRARG